MLKELLSKIFSGGKLLETAGQIVDDLSLSAEEKAELKLKLEQAARDHEVKLAELAQAELSTYIADVQNARAMQVAALAQEDKFAKRFIYYYTILVTVLSFAFLGTLVFVQVPAENQDIAYMGAGAVLSVGLVSIINYFFGSSRGSEQKMDWIQSKMKP